MDSLGDKFVHYSNSSSSLSEVEEDWIEKMSLRSEITSPVGCPRRGSELYQSIPETKNRGNFRSSEINVNTASTSEKYGCETGTSSKQLVTVVKDGRRYVFPFELIADKQTYEEVPTVNENNRKAVDLIRQRVDREMVVGKKQLCGDFFFSEPADHEPEVEKKSVEHCREIVGNSSRCSLEKATDESAAQRSKCESAWSLGVRRLPIYCPITDCQQLICTGFFAFHLKVDHPQVMRCVLSPGETHNILVDPSLDQPDVIRCNVILFLNDKLRDFGFRESKNQLPVLFMSTELPLGDFDLDPQEQSIGRQYMFWFTGITSEKLNTEYTLCIGSYKSQCGLIYPLGQPQSIKTIYESGAGVIISPARIGRLLRPEDNLLPLSFSLN